MTDHDLNLVQVDDGEDAAYKARAAERAAAKDAAFHRADPGYYFEGYDKDNFNPRGVWVVDGTFHAPEDSLGINGKNRTDQLLSNGVRCVTLLAGEDVTRGTSYIAKIANEVAHFDSREDMFRWATQDRFIPTSDERMSFAPIFISPVNQAAITDVSDRYAEWLEKSGIPFTRSPNPDSEFTFANGDTLGIFQPPGSHSWDMDGLRWVMQHPGDPATVRELHTPAELLAYTKQRADVLALTPEYVHSLSVDNATPANTSDGHQTTGRIVEVAVNGVYQDVGRGHIVRHESADLDQIPATGETVRVEYRAHHGHVVDLNRGRERDVERDDG